MLELSVETLAGFYGVALSLAFAYLPGVKDRFDALSKIQKAQVMLGFMVLAVLVLFGLSCYGVVLYGVDCSAPGAFDLLKLLLAAAVANQTAYMLLVRPVSKG